MNKQQLRQLIREEIKRSFTENPLNPNYIKNRKKQNTSNVGIEGVKRLKDGGMVLYVTNIEVLGNPVEFNIGFHSEIFQGVMNNTDWKVRNKMRRHFDVDLDPNTDQYDTDHKYYSMGITYTDGLPGIPFDPSLKWWNIRDLYENKDFTQRLKDIMIKILNLEIERDINPRYKNIVYYHDKNDPVLNSISFPYEHEKGKTKYNSTYTIRYVVKP